MLEKVLKDPLDYSTLFLDMNSFFASAEQQFNPRLRYHSVAVCTGFSDTCTVIAASIEAKRFGVTTGTKVGQAKLLCPTIFLISDSPTKYRKINQQIMALLNHTLAKVVPKSIDEAYLKIPSNLISKDYAFGLSKAIKTNIKKYIGEYLNCSIGIAPNIWLAKMAASSKKPDGLVCVTRSSIKDFLKDLRLVDFNGISTNLSRQFYRAGIYSSLDLYDASFSQLKTKFGVNGVKWYLRLRGYEVDDLPSSRQKSIGHQVTIVPKPAQNMAELPAIITKMSYRIGYRLRSKQLHARGLSIRIKFIDGSYYLDKYTSAKFFNSSLEIYMICIDKIKNMKQFLPIRKIYITTFDLSPEVQQSKDLFTDSSYLSSISKAVDKINNKFGANSIMPASSLGKDFFPDRIGFGN